MIKMMMLYKYLVKEAEVYHLKILVLRYVEMVTQE